MLKLDQAVTALLLVSMLAGPLAAGTEGPVRSMTVSIDSGRISGMVTGNYAQFLGIPYAAPPVGELRWQPPQPPERWAAVRPATEFGNTCPQKASSGVFARPSTTEDCLYLNVFATKPFVTPKPVLVWIHGGGLFSGESDDYDASKLVKNGNLVVVTFNYRIGRLGYFPRAASSVGQAIVANYGLMDQQFALRWVRINIRAFGGDPNNVTIGGESAGAESVYALMVSPASAGLFHRAIAQSGGYTPRTPSIRDVASKGKAFAAAAGCADQSLQCLRALGVEQILAAQNDMEIALVVDGTTLPLSFDTAFANGTFNHVPLISGTTKDEARWFMALEGMPNGLPRNEADYAAALQTLYGAAGHAVLSEYPIAKYGNPVSAIGAAETDLRFACPQVKFDSPISRWAAIFAYEFRDATAPSYMPDSGFSLGAAHTFELQYLFPGFHGASGTQRELSVAQSRLSDLMVRNWSQFALSGDPNPTGRNPPVWPRYSAESRLILSLQSPQPVVLNNDSLRHHCRFWAARELPAR
jgi:para-nitrobenzyl esterase